MNVCTFTGRLGRDGELRTTPGGTLVVNFSLANDIGYGERKTTQWISCAVWGQRAEKLAPYLVKGTQLVVSGEATTRAYAKKDGSPAAELALNVRELDFTGSARDDSSGERTASAAPAEQRDAFGGAPKATSAAAHHADFDDDIPF